MLVFTLTHFVLEIISFYQFTCKEDFLIFQSIITSKIIFPLITKNLNQLHKNKALRTLSTLLHLLLFQYSSLLISHHNKNLLSIHTTLMRFLILFSTWSRNTIFKNNSFSLKRNTKAQPNNYVQIYYLKIYLKLK